MSPQNITLFKQSKIPVKPTDISMLSTSSVISQCVQLPSQFQCTYDAKCVTRRCTTFLLTHHKYRTVLLRSFFRQVPISWEILSYITLLNGQSNTWQQTYSHKSSKLAHNIMLLTCIWKEHSLILDRDIIMNRFFLCLISSCWQMPRYYLK
jgi:hypothetical protein